MGTDLAGQDSGMQVGTIFAQTAMGVSGFVAVRPSNFVYIWFWGVNEVGALALSTWVRLVLRLGCLRLGGLRLDLLPRLTVRDLAGNAGASLSD